MASKYLLEFPIMLITLAKESTNFSSLPSLIEFLRMSHQNLKVMDMLASIFSNMHWQCDKYAKVHGQWHKLESWHMTLIHMLNPNVINEMSTFPLLRWLSGLAPIHNFQWAYKQWLPPSFWLNSYVFFILGSNVCAHVGFLACMHNITQANCRACLTT